MKIYTQNIFNTTLIRDYGISKYNQIPIEKLAGISRRSKLGKFVKELENLLNGQTCTLSINTYNRYGYASLVIELDDKFEENKIEIEKIGYRSNY